LTVTTVLALPPLQLAVRVTLEPVQARVFGGGVASKLTVEWPFKTVTVEGTVTNEEFDELRARLVFELAVWSSVTVTLTESPALIEEDDGVTTMGTTPPSGWRNRTGSEVADKRTESAERNVSTCFTRKLYTHVLSFV
jgi:hypothetical protein